MHNAAIGADRDIDASLLIVFIAGFGNLDNGGCLSRQCPVSRVMQMEPPPMPILTKSAPAFARNRKPSRSTTLPAPTFTFVAVMLTDPGDGTGLPFAVTFGRVDAEHNPRRIRPGGHALGIVAGIDAGADNIALVGIQQLIGMFPLWES